MTHGYYLHILIGVTFDVMKINLLNLSILYIDQSIILLINLYLHH